MTREFGGDERNKILLKGTESFSRPRMARKYSRKRKGYGSSRKASSKKAIRRKGTGGATQKAQILSLAARTNKIEKKQSDLRFDRFFTYIIADNSAFHTDYSAKSLTRVTNWTTVFGRQVDSPGVNARFGMEQKSCRLQIQIESQLCPVSYSYDIYVLSAKTMKVRNEAGTFDTNGDVTYDNLTRNLDYVMNEGRVFINPKRWQIHAHRVGMTRPLVTSTPASGLSPSHLQYTLHRHDQAPCDPRFHRKHGQFHGHQKLHNQLETQSQVQDEVPTPSGSPNQLRCLEDHAGDRHGGLPTETSVHFS